MKKYTQQSQQLNVTLATPYSSVSQAVAALTQGQLDRLLAIARWRFKRLGQSAAVQRLLTKSEPLEYVQDTVMLVLAGEARPGQGRHTHVRHLASPGAFFNFLQGVLQSRISAALKRECHEEAHQKTEINSPLSRTVVEDVVLNEVKAELLARLRAVAGDNPTLQAALLCLDLECPDTCHRPTRKEIWKMRRVGREVLREIAAGAEVQELFQS